MKLPAFIKRNTVLKITSLNASVIGVRLVISLVVQHFLAIIVKEAGIAKIGQLRNLLAILTSFTTLGIFSGLVKYVSEYKTDQQTLQKLFSTSALFTLIGSLLSAVVLFFGANYFAEKLLDDSSLSFLFQIVAFTVPFIAVQRVFNAVINGLSDYKKYAKIELISYILSTILLIIGLYTYNLAGVLVAIALSPIIQLIVLILIFGDVLKEYIHFKDLKVDWSFKNQLLAFTLMSFVSTVLINFIELDVRTVIKDSINVEEAGYWTAINFISKNYMVFSSGLFTLYVLPRFAAIKTQADFTKEVWHIYKTILPIFGVGMLLIYIFRDVIIRVIYPEFTGMSPLFKWQLLGDFIKLMSLVIAHQFLAKRMVKSFIITELTSLISFYILAIVLLKTYSTEGVVMAHFFRNIIYFVAILIPIAIYFIKLRKQG